MSSEPAVPAPPHVPFDVVALAASAGGIEAITSILSALPRDFRAAVLILQHLRQAPSEIVEVFARQSNLPVSWAAEGTELVPGRAYVCPPHHALELHPDRTCSLTPLKNTLNPIDFTLESLADSYRARAVAVVLSGMRNDGAAGAVAIKRLGGTVLAQSEDSAQQPSMPRAAIATGAVDVVFPLSEIARALNALVTTGATLRSSAQLAVIDGLFGGDGLVRPVLRRVDWAATALGPVERWSGTMVSVLRTMLSASVPITTFWGPERVCIYNDAYAALLADLHPAAAGKPALAIWPGAWPAMRERFERVESSGETLKSENELWLLDRRGLTEELYFSSSLSVIRDERQRIVGLLDIALDTTEHVIGRRRGQLVSSLAAAPSSDVIGHVVRVLSSEPRELPFALLYDVDRRRARAALTARVGVGADAFMATPVVDFTGSHGIWPIELVVQTNAPLIVSDLRARFGDAVPGPWPAPPQEALLLPLRIAKDELIGVLIVGLSPVLRLDGAYRAFLERLADQLSAILALDRVRTEDKLRGRALAESDRAKTEFFSNVSHEFRTPLTLAITPIERLLATTALSPGVRAELDLAHRNARRLLTLVNQLLDFTRAAARRLQPSLEVVDLAKETRELAALFRSAIERAGLSFIVDAEPLSAPVRVDRGMWEKIVSNLLMNALKFTFEGEIRIELRERAQHAELTVRDTGVGVPAGEVANLFERFHRVQGSRARTQEGSGIGLALTRELLRLHGGRIRVKSEEGRGSSFTAWIPMLSPREAAKAPTASVEGHAPSDAAVLAETALRWIETKPLGEPLVAPALSEDDPFFSRTEGSRVLVVDDNADMRAYLQRLIEQAGWQAQSAHDGASALALLPSFRPHLLLTDVRMPDIDGLTLLRRVRADPELQSTPVMLVTARAGEAAAVEGLLAGADDHITKPFTARELLARVGAQLELARVRGRSARRDAYRVRLGAALRGLSDPLEIQAAACRVLGQRLRVARAYYAELFDRGERTVIYRDYFLDLPSLSGSYRSQELGPIGRHAISVPIVKNGETLALLVAGDEQPREWTDEEKELTQETADRTWEAMVRARAEAAVALALQRSDLLRALAEHVAPDTAMQSLYDAVMHTAVALASADAGTVQILDRRSDELVVIASTGFSPEVNAHYRRLDASSSSSCGIALARGERTFVDFSKTPDDPDSKRHLGDGYCCALSKPLVTRGGEPIGMITTHWKELHPPDDEVLRFIDILARQAADLIERAHTREQLRAAQAENERLRKKLSPADRRLRR